MSSSTSSKHEIVFIDKPRIRTSNPTTSSSTTRQHPTRNTCSKKIKYVAKQGPAGPVGPTGPAGRSVQGSKGDPGINGGVGPTGPAGESVNDSSIYLMTVLSTSFPNSFQASSSSTLISFVPIIETNNKKSIGQVTVTVTNSSRTFNFKPNNDTDYKVKCLRVTTLNLTATGSSDATITLSSAAALNQIFYLSIVWQN